MRKGRYPGAPKAGIFDERVWRGGASRERVEELRVMGVERRGKHGGGRGSRRVDGYDGDAGFGGDREGYRGDGRDGSSYRDNGRSNVGERLDRRTILGEMTGRY